MFFPTKKRFFLFVEYSQNCLLQIGLRMFTCNFGTSYTCLKSVIIIEGLIQNNCVE